MYLDWDGCQLSGLSRLTSPHCCKGCENGASRVIVTRIHVKEAAKQHPGFFNALRASVRTSLRFGRRVDSDSQFSEIGKVANLICVRIEGGPEVRFQHFTSLLHCKA